VTPLPAVKLLDVGGIDDIDHAQASGWRRNKQADQQAGDHR
jgi:hypothetical protein